MPINKKEYYKQYCQKNKEKLQKQYKERYLKNKEQIKERSKEWGRLNPEKRQLAGIKNRAKEKKLEFNLKSEDLIYPEFCPILGIKLERRLGYGHVPNSPSVDRIDPTRGYTKDNIQIISQLANVMKNNATPEQLLAFANWVLKTYKVENFPDD